MIEKRICLNCGKEFEVNVDENPQTERKQLFCNDCCKVLTPNQRRNIRRKLDSNYKEKCKQQHRSSWRKHYIRAMWQNAKTRAKKYNYEFNITQEDIVIPEICPILEVPLIIGTKGNYEYSPSLDRIDNTKGYIKGNIRVISKKANSMKNSATIEELKTFCKNVLRYSLSNTENECIELKDKEP